MGASQTRHIGRSKPVATTALLVSGLLIAAVLSGCPGITIRPAKECNGALTIDDLSITVTAAGPPAKIHVHGRLTCDKKPSNGFIEVSGSDPRVEKSLPIKSTHPQPGADNRVETKNGVIEEDFIIEGYTGDQLRGATIRVDVEGPAGMVRPAATVVIK